MKLRGEIASRKPDIFGQFRVILPDLGLQTFADSKDLAPEKAKESLEYILGQHYVGVGPVPKIQVRSLGPMEFEIDLEDTVSSMEFFMDYTESQ